MNYAKVEPKYEVSSLADDLHELSIEVNVKTSLKTQEELDKLTVDESLNDIERAVFLLSSGQEGQHISVIRNLPQLIKDWQNESIRKIMPKVKEMLLTAGLDIQMAATEVFISIAKDDILPISLYTQHFLRTIINNLTIKDPVASQAWLDTLIAIVNYLPKETLRREVLGLAIAKGNLSQSLSSRLICCNILGAVVHKFDSNVVKKDIVTTVKKLCQDVDHNVRACMCSHLHTIATALGGEDEMKQSIVEEALELAGDEDSHVRDTAMDALLNMSSITYSETLAQKVVPLVWKYCDQAIQQEDSTMLLVSLHFGKICCNLSTCLNTEQHAWLLSAYRYLCKLGTSSQESSLKRLKNEKTRPASPVNVLQPILSKESYYLEIRQQCSFNFPALVQFCSPSLFESELFECANILCTDSDPTIRKNFAAGFHEVTQALEANAYLVYPLLTMLLHERKVPGVLEACLRRLPDTLIAVVTRGNLANRKGNKVSELIASLLSATVQLEHHWPRVWRPLEAIVTHFRRFPEIFLSDQIYAKFVPITLRLLTTNRYLPVREATACTICVFIRNNRKMEQRQELCDKLIKGLCYARSFRNRILFFTACRHMLVLFSKAFFKENFFIHLLTLFADPVPNVRLCLCKMLPSMKASLKLPRDRALHGQLEMNVRKMLSFEKDRDVAYAIRQAILELDRTKVVMESLTLQLKRDVDIQDQKKEEEEKAIMQKSLEEIPSSKSLDSSCSSSNTSPNVSQTKVSEKNHKLKKEGNSKLTNFKLTGNVSTTKQMKSSTFEKEQLITKTDPTTSVLYKITGEKSPTLNIAQHFSPTAYSPGASSIKGTYLTLGQRVPHQKPLLATTTFLSNSGAKQESFAHTQSTSQKSGLKPMQYLAPAAMNHQKSDPSFPDNNIASTLMSRTHHKGILRSESARATKALATSHDKSSASKHGTENTTSTPKNKKDKKSVQ